MNRTEKKKNALHKTVLISANVRHEPPRNPQNAPGDGSEKCNQEGGQPVNLEIDSRCRWNFFRRVSVGCKAISFET
jgi:hypothetical protein